MTMKREDILGLSRPTMEVDVPGVGTFRIRGLSAKEAVALGLMEGSGQLGQQQVLLFLTNCLVDDAGERMFDNAEAEVLADHLPAAALVALLDAAMKVSGLEELVEGFDAAQDDASSSG